MDRRSRDLERAIARSAEPAALQALVAAHVRAGRLDAALDALRSAPAAARDRTTAELEQELWTRLLSTLRASSTLARFRSPTSWTTVLFSFRKWTTADLDVRELTAIGPLPGAPPAENDDPISQWAAAAARHLRPDGLLIAPPAWFERVASDDDVERHLSGVMTERGLRPRRTLLGNGASLRADGLALRLVHERQPVRLELDPATGAALAQRPAPALPGASAESGPGVHDPHPIWHPCADLVALEVEPSAPRDLESSDAPGDTYELVDLERRALLTFPRGAIPLAWLDELTLLLLVPDELVPAGPEARGWRAELWRPTRETRTS